MDAVEKFQSDLEVLQKAGEILRGGELTEECVFEFMNQLQSMVDTHPMAHEMVFTVIHDSFHMMSGDQEYIKALVPIHTEAIKRQIVRQKERQVAADTLDRIEKHFAGDTLAETEMFAAVKSLKDYGVNMKKLSAELKLPEDWADNILASM